MLQNNGTTPVGIYSREEISIDMASGVYYIEIVYKKKSGRSGILFEYNGADTNDVWRLVPPQAFMRGITNDREVSNYVYERFDAVHCHNTRYRLYQTLAEARAACDIDNLCAGIYGRNCNQEGNSFSNLFLCRGPVIRMENSTEASCIYERKEPKEITALIADKKGKSSNAYTSVHLSALTVLFAGLVSLVHLR